MEAGSSRKDIHISVVSPVYRAAPVADELVERLIKSLSAITDRYEIILVDDRSPDNSWAKVVENCRKYDFVRGIRLSKNFGQHYAITAGLDVAQGDWVVVMDCDLQDLPEEIIKLYNKALEGYDMVYAQRITRNDSFFKRIGSYFFYRVLGYLAGVKQDHTIANFGIYSKKVIATTAQIREKIRYFPTMMKWVGFNSTTQEVSHAPREHGQSSYNFKKLFRLGLDIILAYSDKPLRLAVKLGMVISATSFIAALFVIYKFFVGEIAVMGYPSLIISIWFLSGVIIVLLGVLGLYIGKIFEGVKNRPLYIVDQQENLL